MDNNLVLFKNKKFGNLPCDVYIEKDNYEDFWMTRKQIGEALDYNNPTIAISKIHNRHEKRFAKFSVVTSLVSTDNKAYQTTLYSAKGIYEVCRWSKQPKADQFIDWTYDVLEDVRKHGAYMTPNTIKKVLTDPDFIIKLATELKEEQQRRARDEEKIEKDRPFTEIGKIINQSKDTISFKELADLITTNLNISIGRTKLMRDLRKRKLLCSGWSNYNLPSAKSLKQGILVENEKPYVKDGQTHLSVCGRVPVKGQQYFLALYKNDNLK